MRNEDFTDLLKQMKSGDKICFNEISFDNLYSIKYPSEKIRDLSNMDFWYNFKIYTKNKNDLIMTTWNGIHPVENNISTHTCPKDTKLLVWMVSRFGDIGVTDNLENPKGYNNRGVSPEYFYDWEIYKL